MGPQRVQLVAQGSTATKFKIASTLGKSYVLLKIQDADVTLALLSELTDSYGLLLQHMGWHSVAKSHAL